MLSTHGSTEHARYRCQFLHSNATMRKSTCGTVFVFRESVRNGVPTLHFHWRDQTDGICRVQTVSGRNILGGHECNDLRGVRGELRRLVQWLCCKHELHVQRRVHGTQRRRVHRVRCRDLRKQHELHRLLGGGVLRNAKHDGVLAVSDRQVLRRG